jgi:FdhE protein
MPYVPIFGSKTADLRESAERRWRAIREIRPDLGAALDLQEHLIGIVMDLSTALETGRVPRLSLPPGYLAAKLGRGVPVFAGEPIPLPVPVLAPALLRLCDALAQGGAGEAAAHIRETIATGSIEPGSLLTASLARDQAAIRAGATHRGLAPDLVWLIAELAVSPYIHTLLQLLFGHVQDGKLQAALDGWSRGYCPACGSWPALAEVVGGHRILRCSFCSSGWEPTAYACIYCEAGGEGFVTAAPDQERKDRRIEVCEACSGYLKTMDLPELSPFPLLSISDIESTDLDLAAMEHGYRRPALKEFGVRR